jgi:hypothetical protein
VSTRNLIIGLVLALVVLMGYCGYRYVQIARNMVPAMQHMAATMQARTDTTHHVADGSAVYLDKTLVAPIVGVRIVHPDTSGVVKGGAETLAISMLNRMQSLTYVAAAPVDSAIVRRLDDARVGHVHGTYDSTQPVRIELSTETPTAGPTEAVGMLTFKGRRTAVILYK